MNKELAQMRERMNKEIEKYARDTLKENLTYLGIVDPGCLDMFRRMYSHKDLTAPIDAIVDTMPAEKLDWALTQVQNTNKKFSKEAT